MSEKGLQWPGSAVSGYQISYHSNRAAFDAFLRSGGTRQIYERKNAIPAQT